MSRKWRIARGLILSHQPERTILAHGLVGGEREPGEGEDLGGVGKSAVIRVAVDAEEIAQALVIKWQLPALGQLAQLVPQARQAGAAKRVAPRKRQRHGLHVRGEIDA